MRGRRHVAIVFTAHERGGAEEYVLRVSSFLVARGWRVCAVFPEHEATASLRRDLVAAGACCHAAPLGVTGRPGKWGAALAGVREFVSALRAVRQCGAERVLLSLPYVEAAPGAVLAAALRSRRAALVFHLVRPGARVSRLRRPLYLLALRRSRCIAVSYRTRTALGEALAVDTRGVTVVPNGVSWELPADGEPRDVRGELGLPADAMLVVTTARLTTQKAHHRLLQAVVGLEGALGPAHFVWLGEGPERERLTAAVRDAGLQDRVHLLGHREQVRSFLTQADAFVLPSEYEGAPFALLEAFAAGLPCLATTACVGPDVQDGVHALLVDASDTRAMSSQLERLLTDGALRRRLSADAQALFEREYRAEVTLERLESVLDGL